jgi:hypothetical protein
MATLGAYKVLVCTIEHDVSPGRGLFVQSKRALCPKSGTGGEVKNDAHSELEFVGCSA